MDAERLDRLSFTASSGNQAIIDVVKAGQRMYGNVKWINKPTPEEISECEMFLAGEMFVRGYDANIKSEIVQDPEKRAINCRRQLGGGLG